MPSLWMCGYATVAMQDKICMLVHLKNWSSASRERLVQDPSDFIEDQARTACYTSIYRKSSLAAVRVNCIPIFNEVLVDISRSLDTVYNSIFDLFQRLRLLEFLR